jgi:hypothetical protein
MQYPAIVEMRTQLEAEYADATDLEMMRSLAKQHAKRTMILCVGRTVVYALAKQTGRSKGSSVSSIMAAVAES